MTSYESEIGSAHVQVVAREEHPQIITNLAPGNPIFTANISNLKLFLTTKIKKQFNFYSRRRKSSDVAAGCTSKWDEIHSSQLNKPGLKISSTKM